MTHAEEILLSSPLLTFWFFLRLFETRFILAIWQLLVPGNSWEDPRTSTQPHNRGYLWISLSFTAANLFWNWFWFYFSVKSLRTQETFLAKTLRQSGWVRYVSRSAFGQKSQSEIRYSSFKLTEAYWSLSYLIQILFFKSKESVLTLVDRMLISFEDHFCSSQWTSFFQPVNKTVFLIFLFPESIAKGSSGKSFRHLHLDTHTRITCARILTFVTYARTLTLG